jgi:hypothetical protein
MIREFSTSSNVGDLMKWKADKRQIFRCCGGRCAVLGVLAAEGVGFG